MPPDHLERQAEPRSAWRTLARSFAPRGSRGQVITGLLCALLGFALAPVGLDLDNEGEAEPRAQQTGDDLAPAAARCERVRERAPGRSRFGLPLQVVGWHLRPSAGGAGWPRRWRRS